MAEKKKDGWKTFTSKRKASTFSYQKIRYGEDKFKVRGIVSDKVTVTLQRGVEFDVKRECEENPYFKKLCTDGYMKLGERVKLQQKDLQEFLEAQVGAPTNQVIYWDDRPRTEAERALEAVISRKDEIIGAKDEEIDRLRSLLSKNKIADSGEGK